MVLIWTDAKQHGLTPFSVYQGNWNAAFRDMEGDVIPMCEDQDMAIVSWGSLGTGSLLTAQQRKEREADPDAPRPQISEVALKTSEALERIAGRKGTTLQAIVSFGFTIYITQGSNAVRPWHTYSTNPHTYSPSWESIP